MVRNNNKGCMIYPQLEFFITNLNPLVYNDISNEPNLEEIRASSRAINHLKCDREIEMDYQERLAYYKRKQPDLKKLRKYGETREEVVRRVGEHVMKCDRCEKEYSRILREKAVEWVDFDDEEDLEEIIHELDRSVFGFLDF